MRVRLGLLGLALAAGLGASVAGASVSARQPATARLTAFDGCPAFLAYVRKQALPFVGPWGLVGAVGIAAGTPPRAARDAVAGSAARGSRLLADERPGGGGRRARPRARRGGRSCGARGGGSGARRPRRWTAAARRHAAPRRGGGGRAPAGGRPPARPLTGLRGAARSTVSRSGADPVPVEDRDLGCRRPRSCAMRVLRTRARRRLPRARLVGHAVRLVLTSPLGLDLPFVQPGAAGGPADAAGARGRIATSPARPARGAGCRATRCAAVPARWRRRDGSSSAARSRGRVRSPVSAS